MTRSTAFTTATGRFLKPSFFFCMMLLATVQKPQSASADGFADVKDEEEKAHPWELEDLQQHHKDQRLFDAVVDNNLDLVKVSLKIGAHHHHHKNGYTPLMMAAWLDHAEICDLLIEAGAHLEQKDKFGRTPLTIASLRGSEHCGKALVEAGANLLESSRDSHHQDVVGHANEAANHPDAVDSARNLHRYLKTALEDQRTAKLQKDFEEKKAKKAERAAKRKAKQAEL